MLNEEQEFDRVFKDKGGRFETSSLNDLKDIKAIAKSFLLYISPKYPLLPKINFDFILNDSLGATVRKVEEEYYVGLNIGGYLLLTDMYRKMLASNNILIHIGNTFLESEEKKELNATSKLIGVDFNINNKDWAIMPKDIDRIKYANYLIQHAITFQICHEFAHIIRGHVGYYFNIGIDHHFTWNEFENTYQSDSLGRQTFEMDADSFATNWAFLTADFLIKNKSNPFNQTTIFKTWENFVFHWGFSIYSLLRLEDFNIIDLNKCKEGSHPPAAIRMALILDNVATLFLESYKDVPISPILKALTDSTKEAEKAFTEITYHQNKIENLIEVYRNKDLTNYVFEITNNWNNVRRLVEPHSYGVLPPLKDITSSLTR